jgi:D-arabinose 1-dehydrogenase-like Zn-dependent alcohol dehydrogenase
MYLDMWIFVLAATGSIDYIIDTVYASHPLDPYMSTLTLDGSMVGILEKSLIHAFSLLVKSPNSSSMFSLAFIFGLGGAFF